MSVSRLVAAESARQLPSLLPPESPESEGGRSLASRGRRRNEPPPNPKGRSVRASSIPHSLPPSFVGGGAGAEIGVVVLSGESGSDSALFSLGRREQQSLLLLSEYIAKVSEAYFLRSMFPRLFQLRTNNTTYVRLRRNDKILTSTECCRRLPVPATVDLLSLSGSSFSQARRCA